MPLKKLCPRCNKLIDYSMRYCKECAEHHEEEQKLKHKKYKANREDKWEQSFYSSSNWERVRSLVIARDKGLCLICLSNNKITFMETVHHIVELKEDRSKSLSSDNCISLCESCHQLVHKSYIKNKSKIQEKLIGLTLGQGY